MQLRMGPSSCWVSGWTELFIENENMMRKEDARALMSRLVTDPQVPWKGGIEGRARG